MKFFKCLDFSFYKENYLAIFALILCFLYVKISGVVEIYENTIFENIAILPLIIGGGLCLKAKNHKVFFRIAFCVIVWMILREFSYGRVPFAEIPDNPHNYYPWSHFKYGYLAHVFVGLYLGIVALYGIINKVWVDIIDIIKKVQFPFWTCLFSVLSIVCQLYFEKLHNTVFEETAETVLYCLILALVAIYYKKLKS